MNKKYELKCQWEENSGWKFSFGNKRLWQKGEIFVVATLNPDDTYTDFENFKFLENALDFMIDGFRK